MILTEHVLAHKTLFMIIVIVHVIVVHGGDGLDELTTTTMSQAWELRDGAVRAYEIDPTSFGLPVATAGQLVGGPPALNAELARRVVHGERGPHRDIVVLNAGAGLYTAGAASSIADGIELAGAVIDDGRAAAALERLVTVSNRVKAS